MAPLDRVFGFRAACVCFTLASSFMGSVAQPCDNDSCSSPIAEAEAGSALMQYKRKLSSTKPHTNVTQHGFSIITALKAANTSFCKMHPCTVLLSGGAVKKTPPYRGIGGKVALDESGYKKVAATKDDQEMRTFIVRAISFYDCKVEDDGGLMGIVPWFSGTTAVQSFEKLEEVLLFAVLSHGARWVSYKNTAGVSGDTAALTLAGYTQVAAISKGTNMKRFVQRVCKDMGVKIVDDAGLEGVVKYYSGSAAFQSFERLQSEIQSAAAAPHSWADWEKKKESLLDQGRHIFETDDVTDDGTDAAMFLLVAPRVASKGFCSLHPCRLVSLSQTSDGDAFTLESPSLDEAGYQMVAARKDDGQMTAFIRRAVAEYDCKIEDMGGVMGIVPWFSGTTAVQGFEKLKEVLLFAVLANGKPWISFKNTAGITGKTAALDLNGYVQVAAIRKDSEMKSFARRLCKDMGVSIINEDGFDGMIKFYSGSSNFQSFERLQSEIRSAANSPHTWAV